jgi:hypothetical protein
MNVEFNTETFEQLSEVSREKVCLIQRVRNALGDEMTQETFDDLYGMDVSELIGWCVDLEAEAWRRALKKE